MDRLQQLRRDTGGSRDSTLDTMSSPSESFMSANESSKYFSITETDSSFDISSMKNVELSPSTSIQGNTATETDDLICNLSPIGKMPSPSESYKIGKQIEAANILSGGVNIFDDNDNSYDGNELVIDDNVIEGDEKSNTEQKADCSDLRGGDMIESTLIESETAVESRDTEVVLQIDGKNVDAIDIGNGLYLYRKEGQEELAAVQIIDDGQQEPNFKFLKVRENAEGNLEVYEEIEIEVPKELPTKNEKPPKTLGHVPIKDINKVISDSSLNKTITEQTIQAPKKQEAKPAVLVKPQIDDNKETNEQIYNFNLKIKNSESRKSPLSFTPMTYHSTPNKGVPLTKVMVDLQLQPSRNSDNVKKTIEVHTDSCKHKQVETQTKVESVQESTEDKVIAHKDIPLLENDMGPKVSDDVLTDLKLTDKQIADIIISDKPTVLKQTQQLDNQIDEVESTEKTKENNTLTTVKKPQSSTDSESKSNVADSSADKLKESKEISKEEKTEIIKAELSEKAKVVSKDISKEESKINNIDTSPTLELEATKIETTDNNNKTNDEQPLSNAANKFDINKKILKKEEPQLVKDNDNNSDTKTITLDAESTNLDKSQEKIKNKNSSANKMTLNMHNNSPVKIMSQELKPTVVETPIISTEFVDSPTVEKHEFVKKSENELDEKVNIKNSQKPEEVSKNLSLKLEKPQSNDNNQSKDSKSVSTVDTKKVVEKSGKPTSVSNQASSNKIGSTDIRDILPKTKAPETKPINNNTPVPFGKWTEVNRQAFLNKIKESKVPVSISNSSQQLKQANDLNRRDVLKKIDSQRQSAAVNAAAAKAHKLSSKTNVKNENAFSSNKSNPSEIMQVKVETAPDSKNKIKKTHSNTDKSQESVVSSTDSTKNKIDQRKATINQDLIDRTIEDMLSKPLALPNKQETKQLVKDTDLKNVAESAKEQDSKDKADENDVLDAVEKKMNELHGIPFVERPAHELPKLLSQGNTNHSTTDVDVSHQQKTNSLKPNTLLPNSQPFIKKQSNDVIDIDEDEIIEHEPITGDIKLGYKTKEKLDIDKKKHFVSSKKDVIITEKDFDKFARRNSKTCEDQITVNFGNKQQPKVQTIVEKVIPKVKTEMRHQSNSASYMQKARHMDLTKSTNSNSINLPNDASNKNYGSTNSKLKHAYNMSMNALNQKVSPVTIIEDKPVKVVFIDLNQEFLPNQLNVQGAQLSPSKRATESDNLNVSSCDSLDSDVMDAVDGSKSLDIRSKSKHLRKQVLTPVEAPDLELIEPRDLGVHESPKKKRKLDQIKSEKEQKLIVPKKTYLLGRSEVDSNLEKKQNTLKETVKQSDTVSNHKSAASAIDSLVKAAELLENQASNVTSNSTSTTESTSTTVKRGRGRPRKNPLPESTAQGVKEPSSQKKQSLTEPKTSKHETDEDDDDEDTSDDEMIKENWTMGKINENIVCPICSKLFRSENVVFKHVKHCTGPSPSRSDSEKRSPRRLRRSYEYDLKTDDNSEVTDSESEKSIPKSTSIKRKSREHLSKSVEKEEVVVIEDTPVKANSKKEDKKSAPSKVPSTKTKLPYNTSNLVCEFCGKTFRQLSYLVSHKLQHKKEAEIKPKKETESKPKIEAEQPKSTVFSCEVCKKEFRKLHHLVQHRIIHNPSSIPTRTLRKISSEQTDHKAKSQLLPKQSEDQSAGFRCEPCDKSFRKLHHLVEHRETHREKDTTSQPAVEKLELQHQCDICKKIFKQLELLAEHKEQHLETSSEKSDDKSVKSSLSTRDIIHECSLCYMVFPNEHSLNKHTINCLRKKRQSASKQAKQSAETIEEVIETDTKDIENISEPETKESTQKEPAVVEKEEVINQTAPEPPKDKPTSKLVRKSKTPDIPDLKPVTMESVPKVAAPEKREEKKIAKPESTKIMHNTVPLSTIKETESKPATKINIMKRKTTVKDRMPNTVTKRIKSTNTSQQPIQEHPKSVDSSDDDEIRYMLNPDFKPDENIEGKLFMKIRANKRSSFQLERPNSKDLMKRRTSLQHPPKIPRLKPKPIVLSSLSATLASKPAKPDPVPSTDSDDSDVKYSFPEKTTKEPEKKTSRKSLAQKRQSLNGIAKRKSMGQVTVDKAKVATPAIRPIKRRTLDVEHRCDCGELFSSAALLSRHAVLAHTPPRIRRRRSPPPDSPKRKPTAATSSKTRKSIKPEKTTRRTPHRTPAHKNVPVPEKVRKLLEKSNKK